MPLFSRIRSSTNKGTWQKSLLHRVWEHFWKWKFVAENYCIWGADLNQNFAKVQNEPKVMAKIFFK